MQAITFRCNLRMRLILPCNKQLLIHSSNKDSSKIPKHTSRWTHARGTKNVRHLPRLCNRKNKYVFNKRKPSTLHRTRFNNRVNKTSPIKDKENVDAAQEDEGTAGKTCKILNIVVTRTRRGTTLHPTTKEQIMVNFKDLIKISNPAENHTSTHKRSTKISTIVSCVAKMSITNIQKNT